VDLSRTLHKLVEKPRVLVCAPSNAACDVLLVHIIIVIIVIVMISIIVIVTVILTHVTIRCLRRRRLAGAYYCLCYVTGTLI
jgi:heme/copper-type cytochrome/quinol oxidase subunit 2